MLASVAITASAGSRKSRSLLTLNQLKQHQQQQQKKTQADAVRRAITLLIKIECQAISGAESRNFFNDHPTANCESPQLDC